MTRPGWTANGPKEFVHTSPIRVVRLFASAQWIWCDEPTGMSSKRSYSCPELAAQAAENYLAEMGRAK